MTDASAHALDDPQRSESEYSGRYPQDMPADLTELWVKWEGRMDSRCSCLFIFAPDVCPWTNMASSWTSVIHTPVPAGAGIDLQFFDCVLAHISGKV